MKTSAVSARLLPRRTVFALMLSCALVVNATSQTRSTWRVANPAELEAMLPSRAPVGKERIETEMRTATGIINAHGQVIAAVVLITAGYAADGKYSHFLLVQAPITVAERPLAAGSYAVGWSRTEEGLTVHIYDAGSGNERVTVIAKPILGFRRVESFRIWPPAEHAFIQIGRYQFPYTVPD